MPDKPRRGRPVVDMAGMRCGQLTVLHQQGTVYGRLAAWRVRCDCGSVFVAAGSHLRNGKVTRCRDCAAADRSNARRTHGETAGYLYRAWLDIRASARDAGRVASPTLTGRGRPVCPEWDADYARFAADVRRAIGDRPSVLHNLVLSPGAAAFEPGSVRWAGRADWMANLGWTGRRLAAALLYSGGIPV